MTIHITLADAIRFTEEAISEKPEGYVYINPDGDVAGEADISCSYWDRKKDEPSCLVGQVLHKAGLGETIFGWKHSGYWIGELAHELSRSLEIDEDALQFLERVQERQDQGSTWAESLKAGFKAVNL